MATLNLPTYDAKTRWQDGRQYVFDIVRRKYVALTPEEEVRQRFVHYLTERLGYPASLMCNEAQLRVGRLTRRCDTVVYNRELRPLMIVEYKAPSVTITPAVFAQISRYNIALRVDWLVVSNGLSHYCLHMDYGRGAYDFVGSIPAYDQLLQSASGPDSASP